MRPFYRLTSHKRNQSLGCTIFRTLWNAPHAAELHCSNTVGHVLLGLGWRDKKWVWISCQHHFNYYFPSEGGWRRRTRRLLLRDTANARDSQYSRAHAYWIIICKMWCTEELCYVKRWSAHRITLHLWMINIKINPHESSTTRTRDDRPIQQSGRRIRMMMMMYTI